MTHLARVKDLVYDNRAPRCGAREKWRECLAREWQQPGSSPLAANRLTRRIQNRRDRERETAVPRWTCVPRNRLAREPW